VLNEAKNEWLIFHAFVENKEDDVEIRKQILHQSY
jgi:hypothetical protein